MEKRGVRFLQSGGDFPMVVELGERQPVWGLSRWEGAGIRFVPSDDEGFVLRGDGRHGTSGSLRYEGRKRSHRFTILRDGAFEYDCILNKEPESNVITLLMEGADGFDFFRQPDFVKDPVLAGSYAVYKKETLVGEGTGKLCHIHRPKIIDNRGQWVWGDLSVRENKLCITIPEVWLSEARYPVIVDPVIGTTTIGSQTHWENVDDEEYEQLFFEASVGVNRFLIGEALTGTAAAYVYAYDRDYDGRCQPVLYADTGNVPAARKSKSEGTFDIAVNGSKPAGWRSTSFQAKEPISAGSYVWFGLFCDWFAPRFDYGAKCYWDFWDSVGNDIPDPYPLFHASSYYNFKLSMYFDYSSAQNHTRILTQGVTLTDSRKVSGTYRRAMSMESRGVTVLGHGSNYKREHLSAINAGDTISRFRGLVRVITEQLNIAELIRYSRVLVRAIANIVNPELLEKRRVSVRREVVTQAGTEDSTIRQRGFIRTLLGAVDAQDYAGKVFAWFRGIQEEASALGDTGHLGDYIRGLYSEAGSMTEICQRGAYNRNVQDAAGSIAVLVRRLSIFLRLVTVGLIRDYLIPRFLRSREELVLKSPMVRELMLESKVS
jgi:hypothetical protein